MDVHDTALGRILEGTNQYLVPLYQRPYSWTQKNWDTLWQDIIELAETMKHSPQSTHFTGTLVLEASSVTTGLTQFVVVDGQQRLTTLSVLLAAITREWEADGHEHAARKIRDQYLVNPYADDVDSLFRLRPANFDEPAFRAVVQGQKLLGTESKISSAFSFFQRKIRSLDEAGLDLQELQHATLSGLKFVTITAQSDDNVYRIFESINNTGVRLTQADLVRNFVFMKLGEAGDRVHDRLWLPIVDQLSSEDVEAVFWIDAQWRDPESRKLNVYEQQKKHLKTMDNDAVVAYLENVLDIAGALRQLRNTALISDPGLRTQVARFAQLKTPGALVVATRILFLLTKSKVSVEEATQAFAVLESYLVRRIIAGIPVNSLGRISAAVAAELTGPEVAEELHRLLSTGRRAYIPDSEIRRILIETPIYLRPRRENVKLVLQRLLEQEQAKDAIDFSSMSIEHVLPQKLSDQARIEFAASLEPGEDIEGTHEALVHTIGNLTLTNYNSELSNSPFSVKREERLQDTGVIANHQIARNDSWGKREILERSERLAETAITIWPGPNEALLNSKHESVYDRIDEAIAMVGSGSWTTYGDIAQAVGTVGQVVGAAVSRSGSPEGAWRVLRAGGAVSPEFSWPSDSPYTGRSCQEVLESEGVVFTDGKADPSQRISVDTIRLQMDGVDDEESDPQAV